jgi:hypothetical protein
LAFAEAVAIGVASGMDGAATSEEDKTEDTGSAGLA